MDNCTICIAGVEGTCYLANCGHLFHEECVMEWQAAKRAEGRDTWRCPNCQREIEFDVGVEAESEEGESEEGDSEEEDEGFVLPSSLNLSSGLAYEFALQQIPTSMQSRLRTAINQLARAVLRQPSSNIRRARFSFFAEQPMGSSTVFMVNTRRIAIVRNFFLQHFTIGAIESTAAIVAA